MEVTKDLIKNVANNACLSLSEAEIATFEEDFKAILGYFEKLGSATVSENPSFHPIPVKDTTREDVAKDSPKDTLKPVKDTSDGYIRGPKVV
ncbi:MAG: Asp-tRNA(Asn)/Glu-tRNA(Gln) amidotransferase subunit GatC [Candidatus Woesearchaeota archaeon]